MITDFVVLGAGIFGLSTAIELRRAGNTVKVVNPAHGNDPQAASNDISKIIRMEYGSDLFYMRAADKCIDIWHDWNIEHGSPLYREVGFLLLCTQPMEDSSQVFEWASFKNLLSIGRTPVRLNSNDIKTRFPAFNSNYYCDGFFHSKAGYADAGLTLDFLRNKALSLGVEFADGLRVESLTLDNTKVTGVRCQNNVILNGGHVVVCAGANSQHLIPGIGELLRPTGHPVFHLKPEQHDRQFLPDKFPVFAADISNSGWYGFPMHPDAQVVKVANHGKGLQENLPEKYAPLDTHEEAPLRDFVKRSIPLLSSANLVYTRRCFYSDTFDGHFLIDRHPDFHNLTIGTGGSGHGFKMGPLVGKWIRDAAFGQVDCVPDRFKWRQVDHSKSNLEEARNA